MTQPLALVLYEKLLPGSQVVNRLQDLNYRVQAIADPRTLTQFAETTQPILVLADLKSSQHDVCAELARLKQHPATRHVPVIAFCADEAWELRAAAEAAEVTLVVNETAILTHLTQFLERALQVE